MKKKKKNVIDLIKEIHNEMKQIVLDAGIQEGQYNFAIKNLEKQPEEYQRNLLNWLHNFYNLEYKSIKDLLIQFSAWDYYKNAGITNQPEQIILRKRQKALRETWHGRSVRPKKNMQKLHSSNTEQDSP